MGSSTSANSTEFQASGKPVAEPVYIVDANGNPISSTNALNVNASFSASSIAINDPTTTTQKATVDASGNLHVQAVGAGTAGSPSGGVVSIQGVASGTTVPVSGTVTATNPSVGTDGSAIPTSSTLIGASDGTNLQQLLVESSSNRNLRTGIYSGANEATVTGSNALKVDNSAVTQPISAASLPLPTGASTAAKQPALGTAGSASSDVLTVQGIASMTALKVDGSAVTQPISGTVTSNIGTTNGLALDTSVNGVIVAQGSTTSGEKGPLIQGAVTTSAPSYTTAQTSPISLTTAGAVRVDASGTTQPVSGTITANAGTNLNTSALALESGGNLATLAGGVSSSKYQVNHAQVAGTTVSVNQGTVDGGTQRVVQGGAATGTKSNVASSASSVTILASNTSRKGAMIYNDSTQILYLDLSGGTASATSYSVQIPANSFFELPGPTVYNGAITGIWAAANGNARITEIS